MADGTHTIVAARPTASATADTAALNFTLDTTGAERRHAGSRGGLELRHLAYRRRHRRDGAEFYGGAQSDGGGRRHRAVAAGRFGAGASGDPHHHRGGHHRRQRQPEVTAGDLGADGSKSITAQFSDVAGNSSTTAADVITLDTTAPVVAIGNPGGATNQPSLTVTGTIAGADAGTTIAVFDGATQVGVATISGGTWSANVTLSNGSNVLTAHVSDAAGNTASSGAVTYTLNTTAPTGGTPVLTAASDSGTSQTDDITDVTAPSFTVALGSTVVAGDTVQLLLGGSALAHPVTHTITAADITAGSVSLTVTAGDLGADGSKQIAAQLSDSFGNSSTTAALTITLDTTAPSGGTPVLAAASDSGTSHTDGVTDVTAPTFTVALNPTVAAGDTVQLLLGGSALAHPVTHTITAADITAGSVSLTRDRRRPRGRRHQVDHGAVQRCRRQ